jgi:hypothetical protein
LAQSEEVSLLSSEPVEEVGCPVESMFFFGSSFGSPERHHLETEAGHVGDSLSLSLFLNNSVQALMALLEASDPQSMIIEPSIGYGRGGEGWLRGRIVTE